jgi:hypothetical protein
MKVKTRTCSKPCRLLKGQLSCAELSFTLFFD